MTHDDRSVFADWLVLFSAVLLLVSLFLTWSSLSPAYVELADRLQTLQGVARDPTAWQVYSGADVLLALLAAALLGVALKGPRRARICTLVACVVAFAFAIHAESAPPTDGAATALRPGPGVPSYVGPEPAAGAGETVALVALTGAIAGLALSLATD